MQDAVFFVQLSNASAGGVIDKGRGTVTIIDDDRTRRGRTVPDRGFDRHLRERAEQAAVAHPGGSRPAVANVEDRVEAGRGLHLSAERHRHIRRRPRCRRQRCRPGRRPDLRAHQAGRSALPTATASSRCYAARHPTAEIAQVKATPIDTTGSILWSYASGATSVVPPSVGADAIYTTDSLGVVHAMNRGAYRRRGLAVNVESGCRGQADPESLCGDPGRRPAHGCCSEPTAAASMAVDGRTGTLVWSRSSAFGSALPNLGGVQAQPAALLKSFGGNNDMLLVGTNAGASNTFSRARLPDRQHPGRPLSERRDGQRGGPGRRRLRLQPRAVPDLERDRHGLQPRPRRGRDAQAEPRHAAGHQPALLRRLERRGRAAQQPPALRRQQRQGVRPRPRDRHQLQRVHWRRQREGLRVARPARRPHLLLRQQQGARLPRHRQRARRAALERLAHHAVDGAAEAGHRLHLRGRRPGPSGPDRGQRPEHDAARRSRTASRSERRASTARTAS